MIEFVNAITTPLGVVALVLIIIVTIICLAIEFSEFSNATYI